MLVSHGVLVFVSYPERMQHYTLKSIQDSKGCSVGRKEDEFAVIAELDSRPLAGPVILKLEGCKGTLVTSQVRQLYMRPHKTPDSSLAFQQNWKGQQVIPDV